MECLDVALRALGQSGDSMTLEIFSSPTDPVWDSLISLDLLQGVFPLCSLKAPGVAVSVAHKVIQDLPLDRNGTGQEAKSHLYGSFFLPLTQPQHNVGYFATRCCFK